MAAAHFSMGKDQRTPRGESRHQHVRIMMCLTDLKAPTLESAARALCRQSHGRSKCTNDEKQDGCGVNEECFKERV